MSRSIPSALRAVARSRNPAVRIAKRLATPIFQHMDVVAPARLANGDVLYVDLANAVGRTIWMRGDYESEHATKALIESNLEAGDVFFDVGANVGFFSLFASRIVGADGEVHSFEPLPKLATLMRRTITVNGLTNVRLVEAAVSGESGAAEMAAMKDSAYSHLLGGAASVDTGRGGWHAVSVKAVSLDRYVDEVVKRRPRLIKMDIEGAELEAIGGARALLAHPSGPDVICEVSKAHLARFGHEPKDVFDQFESMGYSPLDPDTGQSIAVENLDAHRYNVFFKKRSR